MLKNGKLDKIIMEAQDKTSNPFLALPYGNVYSTAYVFSFLEKNHPLLFKMCNNYIKLHQSKGKYITKKVKLRCKFILGTLHTRHKVDFITFVAKQFLLQKWFISLYINHKIFIWFKFYVKASVHAPSIPFKFLRFQN